MAAERQWTRPRRVAILVCLVLSILASAGCTTFPMRSQQVWRSFSDYSYPTEEVGTPAFEAALDRMTGSRARPEHSARLLQNGDEAYPAMLELINSAKSRISLETYIVDKDATTDRFFTALKEAAARGVEVRVLVDAAGFRRGMVAQLDELSRHGVQARVFNPFFFSWTVIRGNNRDHRKILVVDGCHAILGGINISDEQAGNGVSGWRDTSLLVSGSAALDAEMVFAETWEQGGRGLVGKSLPLACLNPLKRLIDKPILGIRDASSSRGRFRPESCRERGETAPAFEYQCSGATARVVASAPDRRNSATYDLAIVGINGARERLDMSYAYFVPPLSVRRAILRAAERGVRVRLLLPGVTDVRWVREIGMKFYGELLRAGVEIHEWPHPILHAKTMAVDGKWLTVGSANMDGRSYFLNYEANLAVTDAALAEEAHRRFEEDLQSASRLTLEEWEARDMRQRLREVFLTPLAGQY